MKNIVQFTCTWYMHNNTYINIYIYIHVICDTWFIQGMCMWYIRVHTWHLHKKWKVRSSLVRESIEFITEIKKNTCPLSINYSVKTLNKVIHVLFSLSKLVSYRIFSFLTFLENRKMSSLLTKILETWINVFKSNSQIMKNKKIFLNINYIQMHQNIIDDYCL